MTERKKTGIFLGRLQPQHLGHEQMIKQIFEENDEVVLCIGSAQEITPDNPNFERNPLLIHSRLKTLCTFLKAQDFQKPYTVITAQDIEPDSAWPAYLKAQCGLSDTDQNTIYFGDLIPDEYQAGLVNVGFAVKFLTRNKFIYKTAKNTLHKISSATEIRDLEKLSEKYNKSL
ncbi:MAG: adenylyltransferase/cytidyltransferase family protein [Candidatus Pacebacteria bacterium]|nr:adenylyltransferase/cytidyltransferase family protein [Candidatus Paceibacterota bacterium]